MNTLGKNIESAIKNALEEFIKRISEKHDIESSDLESLWNDVCSDMKISVLTSKTTSKTKTTSEDNSDINVCSYLFSKGVRKGETCGSKTKNGTYCSRHKDHKDEPEKDEKQKKKISKPSKKVSPVSTKSIVLRRNKDIGNKLWHPETCLVFRSTKDKTVIGRADSTKIVALTDEDIENCKRMGFAFDTSTDNDTDDSSKKIVQKSAHKKISTDDAPVKSTPVKPKKDDSDDDTAAVAKPKPVVAKSTPVKPAKKDDSEDDTPAVAKPKPVVAKSTPVKPAKKDDSEDDTPAVAKPKPVVAKSTPVKLSKKDDSDDDTPAVTKPTLVKPAVATLSKKVDETQKESVLKEAKDLSVKSNISSIISSVKNKTNRVSSDDSDSDFERTPPDELEDEEEELEDEEDD